jgi:hypothetical protein
MLLFCRWRLSRVPADAYITAVGGVLLLPMSLLLRGLLLLLAPGLLLASMLLWEFLMFLVSLLLVASVPNINPNFN